MLLWLGNSLNHPMPPSGITTRWVHFGTHVKTPLAGHKVRRQRSGFNWARIWKISLQFTRIRHRRCCSQARLLVARQKFKMATAMAASALLLSVHTSSDEEIFIPNFSPTEAPGVTFVTPIALPETRMALICNDHLPGCFRDCGSHFCFTTPISVTKNYSIRY